MRNPRKASQLDWLKNFSETLSDTIDCGFDKETAIEISNLIVKVRKDIEPYAGRRAALAADVTAIKTPDGQVKTRIDVDLNLVPKRLRKMLRKHPRARKYT